MVWGPTGRRVGKKKINVSEAKERIDGRADGTEQAKGEGEPRGRSESTIEVKERMGREAVCQPPQDAVCLVPNRSRKERRGTIVSDGFQRAPGPCLEDAG